MAMSEQSWLASRVAFLRTISYFTNLGEEEARRVGRELLERSFDRGQLIFIEGESCDGLYLVKSGQVRLFKSSPEGREIVLLVARQGDTFNDAPAFDGGPNPVSATALEAATVYIVPRQTLLSLLEACPAAVGIVNVLAGRLRHLTKVVEDLSFRSVASRLAKLLLELAVAEERVAPIPRLTQDEMASMVGSVRDVVGRALRALEQTGAIKIQGHRILVVNAEMLRKML
ncbi:MAG: Crp/Fnr family transcriptional regulator [Chloroflexi bacterium]|nr:Crp/Fnr family transcriptional regulator [Chloroflexota bacterium]